MTTIAEGLSAVSTALGIVKTLREIDRGVQEAEYKLQIANMTAALADAKLALVDAQEITRGQKAELDKLKTSVQFRDQQTMRVDGFLFRSVEGSPRGRAYCPVCSDEGRFINLNIVPTRDGNVHKCPRCDGNFGFNVPSYGD